MQDAMNNIDRMYVQENRVPSSRDYMLRLHFLLEGIKRTTPQ
jgi:hypothetical protein